VSFYAILLVAIALGTDAFSLALCLALDKRSRGQLFLLPFFVAIFHIFMPLIGLWLGDFLGKSMGKTAAFIGALVLIFIGLQMLKDAWEKRSSGISCPNVKPLKQNSFPVGLWALMLISLSVSLDALTAGLGLGVMHVNLMLTVVTVGIVAGLMTFLGLAFGNKLGTWLGVKANFFGGTILIIIGIAMVF